MTDKPRDTIPTIAVTLFGGLVGGLLWIGRPRLALIVFVLSMLAIPVVYRTGIPTFQLAAPGDLAGAAFIVLSVVLVLALKRHARPYRWHARWYWAVAIGLGSAVFAALLIRSLVLQPFSIPAGSMKPTLTTGDYLFVWKPAYGYSRHSLPFSPALFDGRFWPGEPERGDIVVFRPSPDEKLDYIKRVVGLPGDRIQMIDGVLHINGEAVVRERVGEATDPGFDAGQSPIAVWRETLPNGRSYLTWDITQGGILDDTREFEVPERHYFVLGDNRDNSNDSRLSVGYVPFDNLVGRAQRIFWNSKGLDYSARRDLVPVQSGR